MYLKKTKINKIFVLCFLILLCTTCKKDKVQVFPYARANVVLNIANDLATLGIGSAMICPEQGQNGYMGIIIYRGPDYNDFMAYERLCTNFPNDTCAVTIENGSALATCPCCGSKFVLTDGSIMNGPAFYPLKQYQTIVEGGRLYITN